MTTNSVDLALENELQDAFTSFEGVDYRSNAPAGTVLGEGNVDGAIFRAIKGNSMVRNGKQELPNRWPVYNTRTGALSMVPTATLRYQLSKRNKDDGSRVYALKVPEGIVPPTPIADTCKICYINRGNKHRNFYSEYDLLSHMQLFHTLEWNAMERDRDIAQRREDSNRMERLIMTLATSLRPDIVKDLPEEVKTQITELQASARKGK
jgi:hypothetical protein